MRRKAHEGATIGAVARTRSIPGLVLTEHELDVPLDHDAPGGDRISVFAREIAHPDGRDRPYLLYLEGGPGVEGPRRKPSWLDRALEEFRVLMLDGRGTGRSTPVGALPGSPQEQAAYLRHFRADAITRDAEALRGHLGAPPWSILGQSFGGFVALNYLSTAPGGLREAFFTGGLPALGHPVEAVYAETHRLVAARTAAYLERYPEDRERFEQAVAAAPSLPSGDVLSRRRLAQLGCLLGAQSGPEDLHAILELPPGSPAFAHDVDTALGFARNPIYAVLHEACWADGGTTRWAAERTRSEGATLTGEHVFPWMFDELAGLRHLKDAAELLANHEWPRLYDEAQLARNEVPCAAAIYANDLYVPRRFSEETAGNVRGLKPWLTSELEHDGLRADGGRVLGRLVDLARGRA